MVVFTSTVSALFIIVLLVCVASTTTSSDLEAISNTVNESGGSIDDAGASSSSTANRQADNPLRSFLSRGGRLPSNANMANVREALLSGNLERFTPPPVTEPNCHVDIQVVQRVPGRCIRIANGLPACQTEHWLSINTDECS